jgi:hypothetical protein
MPAGSNMVCRKQEQEGCKKTRRKERNAQPHAILILVSPWAHESKGYASRNFPIAA